MLREQKVAGSNPVAPTILDKKSKHTSIHRESRNPEPQRGATGFEPQTRTRVESDLRRIQFGAAGRMPAERLGRQHPRMDGRGWEHENPKTKPTPARPQLTTSLRPTMFHPMMPQPIPRLMDRHKDHVFTQHYVQPKQYHFCLDSIIFARFVADQVRDIYNPSWSILDVCAGCGVIGFEIAHHLPDIKKINFLEIQNEFEPYFQKNISNFPPSTIQFEFKNQDFKILEVLRDEHYDLIVANPPYFYPQDSCTSAEKIKSLCRFFIDSTLSDLGRSVVCALKPGGVAFLLVKSGQTHGRDHVAEVQQDIQNVAQTSVVADIRGTLVVKIQKLLITN